MKLPKINLPIKIIAATSALTLMLAIAFVTKYPKFDDAQFVALCKNATVSEAKQALRKNANPNAKNREGLTPILTASAYNPDPEIIKLLIQHGAHLNPVKKGRGALMWAARNNPNPEIIETLLENGSDPNEKSLTGETPLMLASLFNTNPQVANLLIQNGAQVNATDNRGRTALIWHTGSVNGANPDIIKILLSSGADLDIQDEKGDTAIIWASKNSSDPQVINILLESGSDVNIKNIEGKRAIDYAGSNKNLNHTEAYIKLERASSQNDNISNTTREEGLQ